jgi:hypothetical protein
MDEWTVVDKDKGRDGGRAVELARAQVEAAQLQVGAALACITWAPAHDDAHAHARPHKWAPCVH